MACRECYLARESAGLYRLFSPNCLWCGARLIKQLGRLQIAASVCTARRRAVLADWLKYGHSETELRALAKAPELPLEPLDTGPAVSTESASRSQGKPRSRGKK